MNEDRTSSDDKSEVSGPGPSRHGEEIAKGAEAGRHDTGTTGADRPAGTSDARSATGVNSDAEENQNPDSPSYPPA